MKSHPLAAAVRKALDGLEVPCAGGTVVVGLSGGPDSVALADALARLAPARRLQVVAAHLDHGLRPGSAEDARFCAELAARLGLAFRSSTAHVRARRRGGGLEAAGREARYAFLRATARDEGALAIAVAHTRDDQAETVLLRLLRGSGSRGLAAMRPRAGDLIRPLLGVSRSEVMSYLAARALPWREDPSNADPAFLRNRVRHELLPYLELRFNRGVRGALARTGSILADEADALAGDARGLLAAIGRRDGDGLLLSAAGLRGAPQAVARLALLLALEDTGGARAIGAVHLERLLGLARRDAGATGRLELPGRREAVARYGLLRIGPRPAEAPAPRGRGLPGTAGLEVAP